MREIEKKFSVFGRSLNEVATILESTFVGDVSRGDEEDVYFEAPKGSDVDFIRVRIYPDGSGFLTTKKKDQASNENRYEQNIAGSAHQFLEFACRTFGYPVKRLERQYFVINSEGREISAYIIKGVDQVFVEVEAHSLEEVNATVIHIPAILPLVPETNSIFELFVQPALGVPK